jgi:hypothetical protein
MYPEVTTISELARHLDKLANVHYRCMVDRLDNTLQITRLIIGRPTSWLRYDYGDVLFLTGTERGEVVADWLRTGTFTNRYHNSFPIAPMSATSVYSNRYPSHSQSDTFVFSKPFTRYQVSFSQTLPRQDHPLISKDAPFFLTVWDAERSLLYEIPEGSYAINPPEVAVYVYIEHPDAWLERIHFSLTALELHLAGMLLPQTKLKVVGSGIAGYDDYPRQESVSIPLPNGRPDYLKIALIQDTICSDYYIDDKKSPATPFRQKRTNVTFAEPEPQEKVRELIDRGEGKTIEFKWELHFSAGNNGRIRWLKTIIAFANGDGGSLIIGVNDEDGAVVGIHHNNLVKHNNSIAKFKDAITTAISDTIDPVPEIEFVDATVDGHSVLVINVQATSGKCYAAYYPNKEIPVYYIRRGATTRVATNNEVQELVTAKTALMALPPSPLSALSFRGDLQEL